MSPCWRPASTPRLAVRERVRYYVKVSYIIPKMSLTGASTERVDTRVLQVIYSLTRPQDPPLYVGQQVDVFIEAPELHSKP